MKERQEIKDGQKLLSLYRERRRYEVLTLEGYKPEHELTHNSFTRRMYQSLSDDIEILSRTIGGRAKTRIRQECMERGIKSPDFKKEAR